MLQVFLQTGKGQAASHSGQLHLHTVSESYGYLPMRRGPPAPQGYVLPMGKGLLGGVFCLQRVRHHRAPAV